MKWGWLFKAEIESILFRIKAISYQRWDASGERSARGRTERGWIGIVTCGTEKLKLKGGQICSSTETSRASGVASQAPANRGFVRRPGAIIGQI
jgi:hypothetical protein